MTEIAINSFAYEAHMPDGYPLSGAIDAPSVDEARRRLLMLGLRIARIEQSTRPARPARLGTDDFRAFNLQLAHLTQAGLPIEQGLRLIAQDMRSGRLASSVNEVAQDLENGVALEEAFSRHASRFPALYGQLIQAGVRGNNLSGVLLNLGRHLELEARLRQTLWRTVSYPLLVMAGILAVLSFIGIWVLPQFAGIFDSFRTELPGITYFVMDVGKLVPYLLFIVFLLVVGWMALWTLMRSRGEERKLIDAVALPLPLIGPVLKRNLIARWLDAVRIGVAANLDLPAAIALAGDAVRSPKLKLDGDDLIRSLAAGQPMTNARKLRLLPASVPATLCVPNADLQASLSALTELYEQQAQNRLARIPLVLTPLLLLFISACVGMVVLALVMPMVNLIRSVSAP